MTFLMIMLIVNCQLVNNQKYLTSHCRSSGIVYVCYYLSIIL